jgi:hypothetical protein
MACLVARVEEGRLDKHPREKASVATFLYDRSSTSKAPKLAAAAAQDGAAGAAMSDGANGGKGSEGVAAPTSQELKAAAAREKELQKLGEQDRKLNKKLVQLKNEQEDLLCKVGGEGSLILLI